MFAVDVSRLVVICFVVGTLLLRNFNWDPDWVAYHSPVVVLAVRPAVDSYSAWANASWDSDWNRPDRPAMVPFDWQFVD